MSKVTNYLKLQGEAFKFTFKKARAITLENPLLPQSTIVRLAQIEWARHLVDTGRGHLLTPEVREAVVNTPVYGGLV